MTALTHDALGDDPVRIVVTGGVIGSSIGPATGQAELLLSQEDADQLTAQLVERQLDRWRDSDTDGPAEATSGVSTGLRAALAYLVGQYGEGAEDMVEALLEVWADIPEEHARHITDAGWSVN